MGLVLDFEQIRPLFELCTDLDVLEPARRSLERATDLEGLRPSLEILGRLQFSGCPSIGRVAGVSESRARPNPPSPSQGTRPNCAQLEGARVVDGDANYFGQITNQYSAQSIFSKLGTYGSKLSADSIWNRLGAGSQFGSSSPWNKFGSGLLIIKNEDLVGRLTINRSTAGAVDPLTVASVCYGFTDRADPND